MFSIILKLIEVVFLIRRFLPMEVAIGASNSANTLLPTLSCAKPLCNLWGRTAYLDILQWAVQQFKTAWRHDNALYCKKIILWQTHEYSSLDSSINNPIIIVLIQAPNMSEPDVICWCWWNIERCHTSSQIPPRQYCAGFNRLDLLN